MQDSSDAAAAVIESSDRGFQIGLSVDWNNNGQYDHPLSDLTTYVESVETDASISSNVPQELMLIEGYSAAKMTVTLSGEYKGIPITGHFSPYNGRSAFYATGLQLGVQVNYGIYVETDNGLELFTQFTGVVSDVQSVRESGIVTLDCLDFVERFRDSLDLRATGIRLQDVQNGRRAGGLANSASIIDLAARANGFTPGTLSGPVVKDEPSTGTVLSVPFHGSAVPEVGYSDNVQAIPFTEEWEDVYPDNAEPWAEGGPYGQLYLNALPAAVQDNGPSYISGRWDKAYWVNEDPAIGWGHLSARNAISCWVKYDSSANNPDAYIVHVHNEGFSFLVHVSSFGIVSPSCYSGTALNPPDTGGLFGPSFDLQDGWNYVECWFVNDQPETTQGRNRVQVRSFVNGADSGWVQLRDTAFPGVLADPLSGLVRITPFYALSDVEVISSFMLDPEDYFAKDRTVYGNSDLSVGKNRFAYTFNQVGTEGWALAKEVAAAEFGVVRFDEHGKFLFENQDDIAEKQGTVVRSFDLSQVQGLSLRSTTDSVRNKWHMKAVAGTYDYQTCYDYASDGPMLYAHSGPAEATLDLPLSPGTMILGTSSRTYGYLRAQENLISPEPTDADAAHLTENSKWNQDYPLMGCKHWFADNGSWGSKGDYDTGSHQTRQKWMTKNYFKTEILNGYGDNTVTFKDGDGQAYFRLKGTMISKDTPQEWSVVDQDSIDLFGPRVFNMPDNFWHQDYDSLSSLVGGLIDKFSTPIPVTDNIVVPGDPRIQLGDTIEIHDPEGMGETIRLQIFGITRSLDAQNGLTDTYQVEVVRPPRVGIWDDPQYGLYDQSMIWGE